MRNYYRLVGRVLATSLALAVPIGLALADDKPMKKERAVFSNLKSALKLTLQAHAKLETAKQEGELDKVGRVRLPPEFRDRMRVDKDVVFAGMGKIIEIWSKQLWEEELEESAKEAPQILDEVRELILI